MINDAEEHQRLIEFYRGLGDIELLHLLSQAEDLTDMAQSILRSEVSCRGLRVPQSGTEVSDLSDEDELGRFASLSSKECVWEFPDSEGAQAAGEMLAEAGITYDLILPSAEKLDMGAPRLAVQPADVARAGQILSKPIPKEFRLLVRTRDQFVLPRCPECRSDDPLLESIDPTNEWLCEVCGHRWVETIPG